MPPITAPVADATTRELAAYWQNHIEGSYLDCHLPNEARAILTNRLRLLHAAFEQHAGEFLLLPVADMLKPFMRHAEPQAYLFVFRQTVPAPAWAAAEAIKAARLGQIANPDFPPTPGRLRAFAWDVARPFWAERRRLSLILSAKPPREGESLQKRREVAARILSQWQKTVSDQRLLQASSTDLREPSCAASASSCKHLNLPDF